MSFETVSEPASESATDSEYAPSRMRPKRDPVPRAKEAWWWLGGTLTLGLLGAAVVAAGIALWENIDVRQLTPGLTVEEPPLPEPMIPPAAERAGRSVVEGARPPPTGAAPRQVRLSAIEWAPTSAPGAVEMFDEWAAALVFLALSLSAPVSMIVAAWVFRVRTRAHSEAKFDNYECGEEPDGAAWIRFHPRYYLIALIFVLFDVEAAFLFPWALNIREVGLLAIIDMFIFLGILMIGWAYAVRKGAIKWQ